MSADPGAEFPLPAGVPDAALNKREVGEFFGVSAPTVDKWVASGMPAEVEGTNGREWVFRASAVWAWKQARDRGERLRSEEAQAAIAAMRLQLVGGRSGDTEMSLSPEDRRKIYAVHNEHLRMMEAANRLLPRDQVREGFEDLMGLFRDALGSLPDVLEREAGLNAKAVAQVIASSDALLDTLARRIEEFFASKPQRDALTRPDLFN